MSVCQFHATSALLAVAVSSRGLRRAGSHGQPWECRSVWKAGLENLRADAPDLPWIWGMRKSARPVES